MNKLCDRCGNQAEPIQENYGDSVITFCKNCYKLEVSSCEHQNNILVKYQVGDSFRVQTLCIDCQKLHGQFVKQSTLDMNKIRLIDKAGHDKHHEELTEKYRSRHEKLRELHQTWEKTQWFAEHNDYLKSMEWMEKRDEVLKRDGNLCQSCLKHKATQVHHLTYKHWRHEPLFDLISVCSECHQQITEMDQNSLIA